MSPKTNVKEGTIMALSLMGNLVVLRDFQADDWELVQRYAQDSEVVRYMPWGPNSEEDTKGFVRAAVEGASKEPRTDYEMAVVLQGTGELIGGCGLYLEGGAPFFRGSLGYCLRKEFWGQGVGTEVCALLIKLGFEQLGLHRIEATCDPENVGSARVMERNGMQREGLLRQHLRHRDGWRDSYIYSILEHEWRK